MTTVENDNSQSIPVKKKYSKEELLYTVYTTIHDSILSYLPILRLKKTGGFFDDQEVGA